MSRAAPRWGLPALLCCAAPLFFRGLGWGLPSRDADRYLFGDRAPWTGSRIVALAGPWENDPKRGADVAVSPLFHRDRVTVVNEADSARAAIVRRYRLFSYQPDEMITLRALAGMRPSRLQLDPRLYQYGGLWIYPVGALVQAASRFGFVTVRADVTWYLDHPEEFGRMYMIARLYSAFWGLVGVAAVFSIVRRIGSGWVIAMLAGLCFACMPVIVNGAHEAKPHLGGMALTLLAVIAAARYVEIGSRTGWVLTGFLCGAATGMVPTAYPVFAILPVMVMLRRQSDATVASKNAPPSMRIAVAGAGVGVATFLLTNPYLLINILINREVLESNLGNSAAMYHASISAAGVANAVDLIGAGTSPLLALGGGAAVILLARRALRFRGDTSESEMRRRALGLLLAVPTLFATAQFFVLATGKAAEYGRFAMLPDTSLLIEAFVAVATFEIRPAMRVILLSALGMTTGVAGAAYLRGFVRDSHQPTSRIRLAQALRDATTDGKRVLTVEAEPAPYCLPPVDLFRWEIRWASREIPPSQLGQPDELVVRAVDMPPGGFWDKWQATPISWADKSFEINDSSSHRKPKR